MKPTLSEQAMVIKFCKFLKKEGNSFAVEVPFFNRSIDLVFTDINGKYHAIEFKLKNWKQAIIQANRYILGADFVFVCIPSNTYTKRAEKEFLKSDCGLILFNVENGKFKIIKKVEQKTKQGQFLMKKGFKYACDSNNYKYLLSLS